jgi:hypothetical protein
MFLRHEALLAAEKRSVTARGSIPTGPLITNAAPALLLYPHVLRA